MTEDQTTDAVVELTEDEQAEAQDAEAGFAAGFAKVAGTEGKPDADADTDATGKPAADVDAEAKAQADAKAAEDAQAAEAKAADEAAYNALPQSLRAQLDKLNALPGVVDKLAGHLGGIKRDLASTLATAKAAATQAGAETPTDKQVQAALSNPDAWKQLKEDFPDWAGPVEAEFTAIRAEIAKQAKAPPVDVSGLKSEVRSEVRGDLNEMRKQIREEMREIVKVDQAHPEWEETINTPEFKAWSFDGGPSQQRYAEFKALEQTDPQKAEAMVAIFARDFPKWWADKGTAIFAGGAADTIKMLNGYTAHQKKVQDQAASRQKQQRRLEGAVTPRGTSHPVSTGISDEEAFARGAKRVLSGRLT